MMARVVKKGPISRPSPLTVAELRASAPLVPLVKSLQAIAAGIWIPASASRSGSRTPNCQVSDCLWRLHSRASMSLIRISMWVPLGTSSDSYVLGSARISVSSNGRTKRSSSRPGSTGRLTNLLLVMPSLGVFPGHIHPRFGGSFTGPTHWKHGLAIGVEPCEVVGNLRADMLQQIGDHLGAHTRCSLDP